MSFVPSSCAKLTCCEIVAFSCSDNESAVGRFEGSPTFGTLVANVERHHSCRWHATNDFYYFRLQVQPPACQRETDKSKKGADCPFRRLLNGLLTNCVTQFARDNHALCFRHSLPRDRMDANHAGSIFT